MFHNLRELEQWAQHRRDEWENVMQDDKKRRDAHRALPSSVPANRPPIGMGRIRRLRQWLQSFRL
ncbi:hypothetical protein [Cohnella sp. GCM10027633]|uniref:hypothetical protein n=1 Tax=unclassified Cohnella TaxID=2636738 RepID=UPI00364067D5